MWKVYSFAKGGIGIAFRSSKYVDGKSTCMVDSKDGFPVCNCRDAQKRRLLEFIVSILHLDKPTRMMITIENTIFGAV